jgi:hypothetical protein
MKKLTIILLLLTSSAFGQKLVDSLFTFKVMDNEVIWQKIFTSEVEDLQNAFKKEVVTNMQLENLQEIGNTISFNVKGENIDFKKYGGTWGGTAIFLQYPQNFLVVIDFKDNRYRVSVKSIKIDFSSSGVDGINNLEDYILKKGKFKNTKYLKKMLGYCHRHYTSKFTIKVKNDDW